MRIVIAPDSFKDSLSADNVAVALKKGIATLYPNAEYDIVPLSDGGEGFIDVIYKHCGGNFKEFLVHDALMRPKLGKVLFSTDYVTAFVEVAGVCGLESIEPELRNPLLTTSFGVGELIRFSVNEGAKTIVIGLGGSATNDGGAGMACALCVKFLDKNQNLFIPAGGDLAKISQVDTSGINELPEIIIACDVTNPFTGVYGASKTYGQQKGATPEMITKLETGMKLWAEILKDHTGKDINNIQSAGAAGGLGGGLMAFGNAKVTNGFSFLAEKINLEKRIADADLVITGEGKMDEQTKNGKVPWGVASLALKHNKPLIGVAGTLGKDYMELYNCGFDFILSIIDKPMSLTHAIDEASLLLENTGVTIARIMNRWFIK